MAKRFKVVMKDFVGDFRVETVKSLKTGKTFERYRDEKGRFAKRPKFIKVKVDLHFSYDAQSSFKGDKHLEIEGTFERTYDSFEEAKQEAPKLVDKIIEEVDKLFGFGVQTKQELLSYFESETGKIEFEGGPKEFEPEESDSPDKGSFRYRSRKGGGWKQQSI